MKYAVYAPNFNDFGDPARLLELALASEAAGWDGFFIWDHLAFEPAGQLDVVDATVVLGAVAQATKRLRFGAMVTPIARRRPWKLAREMVTLDHLSGGRIVLGVGLGEPAELEFGAFGEDPSAQARAARLDEGLEIFDALVRNESVDHQGQHFHVTNARFAPPAVQSPRMPIWVAASLPARAGLRRAARFEGVFPVRVPADLDSAVDTTIDWRKWWLTSAEFSEMVGYIASLRGLGGAFDYVASGRLGEPGAGGEVCQRFAEVGATWWLAWVEEARGTFAETLAAVKRGPPK